MQTENEHTAPFAARLREHHRRITAEIRTRLGASEMVLFDGAAVASDDAADRYRDLAKRHRVILVELVALFALLASGAYLIWRLLIDLSG